MKHKKILNSNNKPSFIDLEITKNEDLDISSDENIFILCDFLKETDEFFPKEILLSIIDKNLEDLDPNTQSRLISFYKNTNQAQVIIEQLTKEIILSVDILSKVPEIIDINYKKLIETNNNIALKKYKEKLMQDSIPDTSIVPDKIYKQRFKIYQSI